MKHSIPILLMAAILLPVLTAVPQLECNLPILRKTRKEPYADKVYLNPLLDCIGISH